MMDLATEKYLRRTNPKAAEILDAIAVLRSALDERTWKMYFKTQHEPWKRYPDDSLCEAHAVWSAAFEFAMDVTRGNANFGIPHKDRQP